MSVDEIFNLSEEKERRILNELRMLEKKMSSPGLRYSFFIEGNTVRVVASNAKTGDFVFEVVGSIRDLKSLEVEWRRKLDEFAGIPVGDKEKQRLIELIVKYAYFPITRSYIEYLKGLDVEKLRKLAEQLPKSHLNRRSGVYGD